MTELGYLTAIPLTCFALLAQEPRNAIQEATAVAAAVAKPVEPIDFAKIDRRLTKLPRLASKKPLYGLFLFGRNGEHRVWAVFDKSADAPEGVYDVLYIDRNADGDLRGENERVTVRKASKSKVLRSRLVTEVQHLPKSAKFDVGDFREPGSKTVHTKFEITYTKASVRFRMLWRGEKVTMGCYGPTRDTYQQFAATPAEAPVFVPGYDRPFEFDHWMSGTLRRGRDTDFKVFVGNRGDRRGAFTCVDQHFLPEGAFVQATLLYKDTQGKQCEHRVKLTSRC